MGSQRKLPGFTPERRRRGRTERRIDDVGVWVRQREEETPLSLAVLGVCRVLAAALDRLEQDPDRSEHTVATVGRVLLDGLDRLEPPAGNDDAGEYERFAASIRDAVGSWDPPTAD